MLESLDRFQEQVGHPRHPSLSEGIGQYENMPNLSLFSKSTGIEKRAEMRRDTFQSLLSLIGESSSSL